MSDRFENQYGTPQAGAQTGVLVDEGLRQYMLKVYNYMASGVLLTGIISLAVYNTPALLEIFWATNAKGGISPTIPGWIAMLAPIGLVFWLSAGINRMQASTAQAIFWGYAALVGVSLSNIMMVYTGESVARTFFITAATFGALSLYGYSTKKDISGWGTFLFMGLVGLIIASVVNIFMQSSMMSFIISAAGVLIFAGLTAYDTQQIKWMYYEGDGREATTKKAVLGALNLYMDFINLFLMLLRFLGERRD